VTELRELVKELAGIVSELPENLQPSAFEILLRHRLGESMTPAVPTSPKALPGEAIPATPPVSTTPDNEHEIAAADIHIKAQHFLKKHSLWLEQVNNLFYKEGPEFRELYEELKTTRMAEAQIRIALLQALKNGLASGDFVAMVEAVREETKVRKCYDSPNFAANFKNSKSLFDFETYTKETTEIRLSEDGRKELAALIGELQ
jgi:hypothetical protein